MDPLQHPLTKGKSGNPFGFLDEPSSPPAPSKAEDTEALFMKWFNIADADHDGKLTGQDAVKFFERAGLAKPVLAKVWAYSDVGKRGFLDQRGFAKAMDLISIAQQCGDVDLDLYSEQLPRGIDPPQLAGMMELIRQAKLQDANENPFGRATTAEPAPASPMAPSAPPAPMAAVAGAPLAKKPSITISNGSPPLAAPATEKSPIGSYSTQYSQYSSPVTSKTWKRPSRLLSTRECTSIVDGLKSIYFRKIRPLEELFKFGAFFSSLLTESDFEAKPSVLLLGQYSTGKTTFIKHLLGQDYPGCHIGPEPTTDRFVVVMHGPDERRTPGNTLVVTPDKPFTGLSIFGNGFLSKFEAATCPNRLLEEITLVDTPGVLSGEKQRIERTYPFIEVCSWFAARCDLILLLFDPHKLDISDEFKQVISALKGHDDKVRVVLNKADQIDQQQLMRVYGALMWSLGKVFRSPEVSKVYIGSFNAEAPIRTDVNPYAKELFEKEQEQLLQDLFDIPQRSCDRKVNEFVKRIRAAKIHILIMGHLRKEMPSLIGKAKAQEKLLAGLAEQFVQIQREYHLPPGDFPDVYRYREILSAYDISTFPKLKDGMVKTIEDVLSVDIPNLVRQFDNPYTTGQKG